MRNHLACNIGENGKRWRLWLGAVLIALGVASAIAMAIRDASLGWLVPLFFLFWGGALGLMQAKERTCVVFAALGVREAEGGLARERDSATLRRVRRRSLAVLMESAALGALLTLSVALLLR